MFRLGNKTADQMYAEARRNLGLARTGRLKRSFCDFAAEGEDRTVSFTIRVKGVKKLKQQLDLALKDIDSDEARYNAEGMIDRAFPAKHKTIEAEYEVIE